ncbi:hypothetical protein QBC39DRAFT_394036 [Podospora conica]|nr:hypothetical protein QBC39DRAFT_394036 [Schizothecium conicum]
MKRSREPEEDPSDPPSPLSATTYTSDRESSQQPATKITELDPAAAAAQSTFDMRCSLPPHREPVKFASYEEFEAHYHKTHTNRCLECRKNLPSAHLLSLHIEEMHDAFAVVKRERGERTYSCFVEDCEKKCSTPQKRRMHLIDKHIYPKNFFFAITRDGIDGRRSLLLEGGHRRRRSSLASMTGTKTHASTSSQAAVGGEGSKEPASQPQAPADQQVEKVPQGKPDVVMDDLSGAMSALQFVPPSIRFGRGGRKAGFAKR